VVELPPDPDAGDQEPLAGAPTWVKVFGAIALVVVLLFVVLLVTGRAGDHGPGRHATSDDARAERQSP